MGVANVILAVEGAGLLPWNIHIEEAEAVAATTVGLVSVEGAQWQPSGADEVGGGRARGMRLKIKPESVPRRYSYVEHDLSLLLAK